MVHCYLVICANRNPEPLLKGVGYVHVKARVDGAELAILSLKKLSNDLIVEKSEAELQLILDKWIDAENIDPPSNSQDKSILQTKIDLAKFVRGTKCLTGAGQKQIQIQLERARG